MHAVVEARSMFRVVPRGVDEQKGAWLRNVGRLFGLTYSQAKKIEYEEVKDMRASRLDAMRATFTELQERAAKREELLNGLINQLAEIRSRNGRGDPAGDRGRASSLDSGGNRAGEGGDGADRPAVAAVPRSE